MNSNATGASPMSSSDKDPVAVARAEFDRLVQRSTGSRADRQACVDELCIWLRQARGRERRQGPIPEGIDEIAQDVERFIASRLRYDPTSESSFSGLDIDLSGTKLDKVDFSRVRLIGGIVDFQNCQFGSQSSFVGADFGGARVIFDGASFEGTRHQGHAQFAESTFRGSEVSFRGSEFRGGVTCFDDTHFESGRVDFASMRLIDSVLSFVRARFAGALVSFSNALLESGSARFSNCRISDGRVGFDHAMIKIAACFGGSTVEGGMLSFDRSDISSPRLSFGNVRLKAGSITMREVVVSGGQVTFERMTVDGGELVMDGAVVRFGNLNLSTTSFISGGASMAIEVEFDGSVDLPWARYRGSGVIISDPVFDGSQDYDFVVKVATYRPGVLMNWERFRP